MGRNFLPTGRPGRILVQDVIRVKRLISVNLRGRFIGNFVSQKWNTAKLQKWVEITLKIKQIHHITPHNWAAQSHLYRPVGQVDVGHVEADARQQVGHSEDKE